MSTTKCFCQLEAEAEWFSNQNILTAVVFLLIAAFQFDPYGIHRVVIYANPGRKTDLRRLEIRQMLECPSVMSEDLKTAWAVHLTTGGTDAGNK